MKASYKILLMVSLIILLPGSCAPPKWYFFSYWNSSDHTISLLRYRGSRIVSELSFFSLPPGQQEREIQSICSVDFFGPPFMERYPSIGDSVVVIFNDTLRVLIELYHLGHGPTTAFGHKCPTQLSSWKIWHSSRRSATYAYEFTNWHFDWAIENAKR